jgi:hypothetical protein
MSDPLFVIDFHVCCEMRVTLCSLVGMVLPPTLFTIAFSVPTLFFPYSYSYYRQSAQAYYDSFGIIKTF